MEIDLEPCQQSGQRGAKQAFMVTESSELNAKSSRTTREGGEP